jgi:hypothetical protein
MLETARLTSILVVEASTGIKPETSVTITSHEPAAAGVFSVQVIYVEDAVTVPHSELESLTLTLDVGRFVPEIVKSSPDIDCPVIRLAVST